MKTSSRKSSPKAAAPAAEALSTVFERAAIGIAHIDLQGLILKANAKLCQMLGRSAKTLVGTALQDLSHPEDRGAVGANLPLLRAGRIESLNYEKRYRHRTGRAVWVRASLVLVRDKKGRPDRLVATMEDITARREAEQARDESHALLAAALDSTADGVLLTGLDKRVTAYNRRFRELLGLSDAALRSGHVDAVFGAMARRLADPQGAAASLEALYANPTRESRDEILFADGRVIERVSVPQRAGATITGRVCSFRDITDHRRNETDLLEAKRRLQLAMDVSGVSIWDADLRTGKVYLSPGWSRLLGEPPHEMFTTVEALTGITHPEDIERVRQASLAVMKGKAEQYTEEHRVRASGGGWRWVRSGGRVIERDAAGRALRMIGTNLDVTDRKEAEQALRLSEERLQAAVRGSGAGIWDWNVATGEYFMSARLKRILGFEEDELRDERSEYVDRIHAEDRPRVDDALHAHFHRREPFHLEYRLRRKDGSYVWCRTVGQAAWDDAGRVLRFSGTTLDIDAQKRAEASLERIAQHDSLTGLPNRNLLRDRLRRAILRARRGHGLVGVMFIDLDRFKVINDTLGHDVGDKLLLEVSKRLTECTRGGDTVARLGGDEFAVVLPDLPDAQTAGKVAQKILERLSAPLELERREVYVTASIGITVYPSDSEDQDTLVRNADVAMYRAKEQGRANFQYFTPEMNQRTLHFLELESRLRQALARDEFLLQYQARADVASGHITGAEALLRWRPQGSDRLVAPVEFIPLLEETGMIVPVGEWVLSTAFEQLKQWRSNGVPLVPVAVNVSPRQFQRRELVPAIRRMLSATGIAPGMIELEITEGLVMQDTDYSVAAMKELNALGVPLAIDDFGTGYSSLSYLKRFAIDRLKIDRSFIRDLTTDPDDAAIITAVIAMAHKLGLRVVAEGVETVAQKLFLQEYGCDEFQGNLFSPPVDLDRFEVLLATQTISRSPAD